MIGRPSGILSSTDGDGNEPEVADGATSSRETPMLEFNCHACGQPFDAEVENDHGTYEVQRCPNCGSVKTTLL